MIQISTGQLYILALTVPMIPAWYLHEGTHWFVGWLCDTDPKMKWLILGVPIAVEHGKIETLRRETIRFLGLGIFVWLPVQVLALGYLFLDFSPKTLFMAMLPFYLVFASSTRSDRLAIREPERYRHLEIEGDLPGTSLFFWVVKNWFRRLIKSLTGF